MFYPYPQRIFGRGRGRSLTDDDIEVKVDREDRFRLDEETGLLTWRVTLASGATDKTRFGYTVKYPKGQRVRLE